MEKGVQSPSEEETEKEIIQIETTGNYGVITPSSKYFDDAELFSENIFDYRIIKIKIFFTLNKGWYIITGIQIHYENKITKETLSPGPKKSSKSFIGKDDYIEIQLRPMEYLVDFHLWMDEDIIRKIQFISSKGKIYEFGKEKGIKTKSELEYSQNIILATFGGYDEKLDSFGVYYVSKSSYVAASLNGFFQLKLLLKKCPEKKKEIMEKYNTFNQSQKAIFKVCCLPNAVFFIVLKYLHV